MTTVTGTKTITNTAAAKGTLSNLSSRLNVSINPDGTFVSLPADKIMAFGTAVRAHVQGCFDHEAELLPLIEAATTEAELDAIKWGG